MWCVEGKVKRVERGLVVPEISCVVTVWVSMLVTEYIGFDLFVSATLSSGH